MDYGDHVYYRPISIILILTEPGLNPPTTAPTIPVAPAMSGRPDWTERTCLGIGILAAPSNAGSSWCLIDVEPVCAAHACLHEIRLHKHPPRKKHISLAHHHYPFYSQVDCWFLCPMKLLVNIELCEYIVLQLVGILSTSKISQVSYLLGCATQHMAAMIQFYCQNQLHELCIFRCLYFLI